MSSVHVVIGKWQAHTLFIEVQLITFFLASNCS